MKAPNRRHWMPPRYQRGVAAVELAILSMVLFFFLTAPLLIARSLMQATIAQRATYNATHMLATYPQYLRLDPNHPPIAEVKQMLIDSLDDAHLGPVSVDDIAPTCDSSPNCSKASSPSEVSVSVLVSVLDPGSMMPTLGSVQLTPKSLDRYAN